MILAALDAYYHRLLDKPDSGIAAPGYSPEKIGFAIELAADGHVVDVIDLRDHSGKKPQPASLSVPKPEKRTVDIKSNFLWDKTSYVLGVSATSKRSQREHAAFQQLHADTLGDSDDTGARALLRFLSVWRPESFAQHPAFARYHADIVDANVVFRLEGERQFLHERSAARAAWARLSAPDSDSTVQTCLISGDRSPIARLHPAIKGVLGAQSSGASIVSFNLDAFSSYGKTQGENAPIGERAAFAYTTALNHLLRRDPSNRQRIQIGDATVVFWALASDEATAEAAEDMFAAAFLDPREGDDRATSRLRDVLEQVRQHRPLRDLGGQLDDGTQLFVLGLAPNASRLSVRFWESGTLATFARRLADHYDDLELKPAAWRRPPTPQALALATAPLYDGRAKSEDVSPLLAGELSRAILSGGRYPRSVLSAVVMRLRADGKLTDVRAALCKGVLARDARLGRKDTNKGVTPVSLDTANTDPGYLLGRLFSTLEHIQRAALGTQINATIRDRYYGAASATPAGVFPVLLRNAQNHLSRLRKDKPGFAVMLEKEIGQVVDLLEPTLPRSLPIEAQGRFAIGYYHQTKARFVRSDDPTAETETEAEGAAAV